MILDWLSTNACSCKTCCLHDADIGESDGIIGTMTRRAIVAEQQSLGMQPPDGRAGQKILQALQREVSASTSTPRTSD